MSYVNNGFKETKTLITYISKRTNILESIIERKMLTIILSIAFNSKSLKFG